MLGSPRSVSHLVDGQPSPSVWGVLYRRRTGPIATTLPRHLRGDRGW
jgi:hypothetical protein